MSHMTGVRGSDRFRALKDYLGKNVCTERPATPEETARNGPGPWGGEGVVVEVAEDADGIWFMMDWGMGWVITPDTTITVLPDGDPL